MAGRLEDPARRRHSRRCTIAAGRDHARPAINRLKSPGVDMIKARELPVCRVLCHGARRGKWAEAGLATYSNASQKVYLVIPRPDGPARVTMLQSTQDIANNG